MLGGVQVNVGGCKTCWGGARMKLGGGGAHPPHPPRKSASVFYLCKANNCYLWDLY